MRICIVCTLGAPARRVACRSLVVARTVCTEFRDPEGRRRTVFRVCSRCTRLSANSCGLELVVRRECACAVLTTVTNAGGPLVPWPRHVCVVEKLRGVHMFYRCLHPYAEYRSVAVWEAIGQALGRHLRGVKTLYTTFGRFSPMCDLL